MKRFVPFFRMCSFKGEVRRQTKTSDSHTKGKRRTFGAVSTGDNREIAATYELEKVAH
jgi:hypothetical protein